MRRSDRELSDIVNIEEIINKADVCRIALANDNIPYIVTMNFGYMSNPEKILFFHCANDGKKLDMIRENNYVCFEMDTDHRIIKGKKGCDWGMRYSSVVGYGEISIITENEAKRKGLDCIMKHYGGENEYTYSGKVFENTTVLRLEIREMNAKKR